MSEITNNMLLNKTIAKLVPYLPVRLTRQVAARYIAGVHPESALTLAGQLKKEGFETTMDILGEDTTTPDQAEQAGDAYLSLMEMMAASDVPLNVSLKLTQFGLRIDQDLAFNVLNRVLVSAKQKGIFVRIDMEDADVTDMTLAFYERARGITNNVGTVLQARLKRTVDDAVRLAEPGVNIRLCRGVYKENRTIAYYRNPEIHQSFIETFRTLASGGCRVAVATHDLRLIRRIEDEMAFNSFPKENIEFQSLLGVPIGRTLRVLKDKGYRVRIYIPFGEAWFAYSMRRLRENPELATSIIKGFFRRDPLKINL